MGDIHSLTAATNPNNANPKTRVCSNCTETGTCSYGDKCIFKHVTPKELGGNKPEPTAEAKPEKLRLCMFHKNGKCLHGDNCRWRYDLPSEQHSTTANA